MVRGSRLAVLIFSALAVSACGGTRSTPATSSASGQKGQYGVSYFVNVSRPVGGTITSGTDGKIDCGAVGTHDLCGPASFAWGDTAVLSAVADTGQYFQSWAGDCSGSVETGGCRLDTLTYGADKWVVAVFNPPDQLGHSRIPDPAQHSPLFFRFIKSLATPDPAAPRCTNCHGGNYTGVANAPSCNACHSQGSHAQAGHPSWLQDCDFCHAFPPAISAHASIVAPVTPGRCNPCHSQTVDASGAIIPTEAGGKHMDGVVEAAGHGAAWMDRASTGFHAFSAAASLASCQGCHGTNLDGVGGSATTSCADCHGPSWKTNCILCHGGVESNTGAPPRGIWGYQADATRIGAHSKHLTAGAVSAAVACSSCHVVPATALSAGHLDGPSATVTWSGLSTSGNASPSWDRTAGTCASTYCHGGYSGSFSYSFQNGAGGSEPRTFNYSGSNATPAWTDQWTPIPPAAAVCTGCHGIPPKNNGPNGSTPVWHSGLHGAAVDYATYNACSFCHPGVDAAGTAFVDVSRHIDGLVDVAPTFGSSCFGCH
jgi:hypothetical protein